MFGSKQPWGWLYPYQGNLPVYALKEQSYVVGADRKDAVVITEDHVGSKVSSEHFTKFILNQHLFKIKHKDDVVELKSISDCDIFINKTKIARSKEKYELHHNDILAIVNTEAKVFVYLDNKAIEAEDLPKEIKEKYVQSMHIGEGGFGVVTLVFHKKTGKKYAMKKITKKPKQQKYADTEKKILTAVNHPHVINMEEEFDMPDNLYIVLEYMEGGDLSGRIRKGNGLIENIAKFYFFQIALAVEHLHSLGIAHRDLKPENILLSSNETYCVVKVTDFGVSKAEWNTKLRTSLGTPLYEAPEVIRAAETGKAYTNKVDVWSLGVILFYCLSGQLPFQTWDDILNGKFQFPREITRKISTHSVDIVNKMLSINSDRRLDIKQILKHKWLEDTVVRIRVDSLSKSSQTKGAPVPREVPKVEVEHTHAKLLPGTGPHKPKPDGAKALRPFERNLVQPRPVHVEKNVAVADENKPVDRRFYNERRRGQPRGILRFMPADEAKRQAVAAPPHPEALEQYRRIDNRKTQPFPGIVKNNVHKFEVKKP